MDKQYLAHEQQHEDLEDQQAGLDLPADDPELDREFAQAQQDEALRSLTRVQQVETVDIPLDQLITSSTFQIRAALMEPFVREHATAYMNGGSRPPIEVGRVLGSNGRPVYYIVDGFHRVEALKRIGRTTAEARITDYDSLNDVKWRGWQLNQHGARYTREERIKAFELYLTMGMHLFKPRAKAQMELKSIRQIAREWGKDPATIWKLIKKVNRPLHNRYLARNGHLRGRAATNSTPPPPTYRKLTPLDAVRSDCKDIINIARGELPEGQTQIMLAVETMTHKLKNLDAQDKPWTPEPMGF